MKKFVFKIFALVIGCMLLVILPDFLVVKNQYSQNYNASIIDKMERLKSIKEPKIVLVGNSNVAFGIRSRLIEEEFKMPVVNLGLHGGLGNVFHEKMVEQAVNSGDIIIICHTDYGDDGKIGDYGLAWITIEKHIGLWKLISKRDIIGMVKAYPHYMQKCLKLYVKNKGNKASDDAYQRMAFNIYGDNIWADTHKGKFTFSEGVIGVPGIDEICVNRINRFNEFVLKKNARLLVAGYPIGDGEFTPPKDEFKDFERELREKLNCPVISHFDDYFFDYDCFYDTRFHLNSEGAVMRTEQLIRDLKDFLNSN